MTILAGGVGSRFWPASTPSRPKQLLPLASDRPLVADTLARARALAPDERIRVLAGASLVDALRATLPDLPPDSYLIEPRARGTAPVLAWAAHEIARRDPEAVLVSLHADHRVGSVSAFAELLGTAARLADHRDALVTIGAPPDRPEVGFGYIQPGDNIGETEAPSALRVEDFHEKPDAATAAAYVEAGYTWNTGIFVWRASAFLDEVRRHAPEVSDHLELLERGDVEGFFTACPTITVDVAVLERSENVLTLPCTFGWDDIGGWEALARVRTSDGDGNVAVGDAVVVESSGNVVFGEGGPVVLFGVSDLVVVRTRGVTMVTRREHAPELKRLLAALPDRFDDPEV